MDFQLFEKTLSEIRQIPNYKKLTYELKEFPNFFGQSDFYFSISKGKRYIGASRFLSEKAARAWCEEIGISFEPKKMEF